MKEINFRIGRTAEGFEVLRTIPSEAQVLTAGMVYHAPFYLQPCDDVSVGMILSGSVRQSMLGFDGNDVVYEGDRKIGFPSGDETYAASSGRWILKGDATSFTVKFEGSADLEDALANLLDKRYRGISVVQKLRKFCDFVSDGVGHKLAETFEIKSNTSVSTLSKLAGMIGTIVPTAAASTLLQMEATVKASQSLSEKGKLQFEHICDKIRKGKDDARKTFHLDWDVFKVVSDETLLSYGDNGKLLVLAIACLLTSDDFKNKFADFARNGFNA